MKIISFRKNGAEGVGVMTDDENFVAVPATMLELLQAQDDLAPARAAAGKAADMKIGDVELLPVVANPPAIWCIGVNYKSHQDETGRGPQDHPMLFLRIAQSQVANKQPIIRPNVSDMLDFEGELAVIIGCRGRHVAKEDALGYVAGYACYNEASVRDWQRHTNQFGGGKNFEGTGAFGPWMVTADEFGDPYGHDLTTRLNGEEVQRTSISAMDYKIEELIEYISTFTTINPGDVISTGTPGGVGSRRDPPLWMKPGDVVTVEISGIGTLENPIVQES